MKKIAWSLFVFLTVSLIFTLSLPKIITQVVVASTVSEGKIAFTSERLGKYESKVYLMNADGSDQTEMTGPITINNIAARDHCPSFSPDGTKIAFYSSRTMHAEIYIVDIWGNIIQLTTDPHDNAWPSWSPDGKKIAFVSNRDGNYQIYVMNTDGSNQTRLTDDTANDLNPRWLPNGSIIFTSDINHTPYIINVDGSGLLQFNGPDGVWAPDNSKIAFISTVNGYRQIFISNIDGSNQTMLTNDNYDNLYPAWSPDSKKIAFASNHNPAWDSRNSDIYIMNADGSNQTKITTDETENVSPSWTINAINTPSSIVLHTTPLVGTSVDVNFTTQPVILVKDQSGNPMPGIIVAVSLKTGSGTLTGNSSVITDDNGIATFTNLGYTKSGETFTIHFTAGGLGVDSTSLGPLSAGAATQIKVETKADGTGTTVGSQSLTTGSTLTIYGITRDQYSNFVANPTNTSWSLTSNTGSIDNNDLSATSGASVTFTGHLAGTTIIHAVNGSFADDSGTITVTAGTSASIVLNTTPIIGASVDFNFATQPVILIKDQANNPISGVTVIASLKTGTGTLKGTLTATSDANGLASFTNLAYTKSGETFFIHFTAGGLSIDSASLGPLSAGVATQIKVETKANGTGTTVGSLNLTASSALTIYAITKDQYSNFVTNPTNTTWSLTSKTGGIDNNDLSATSGASVTFTGHLAGTTIIHAVNGSLGGNSGTITVTAGAATQIKVETAAYGSGAVVGAQSITIGSSLTVYGVTRDQYGNYVGSPANTTWSLTSKTSGVDNTDLSATSGANVSFTGKQTGTAIIQAVNGSLSGNSGTITVIAASSGGGGGSTGGSGVGGGGSQDLTVSTVVTGLTPATNLKLNLLGQTMELIERNTIDNRVSLKIFAGTYLTDRSGKPIEELSVIKLDTMPAAPSGQTTLLAYEFGPARTLLSPAAVITFTYSTQIMPSNGDQQKLKIGYWNGSIWDYMDATLNAENNTISFKVNHFCTYALLYDGVVASPAGTTTTTTTVISTTTTTIPTTTNTLAATKAVPPPLSTVSPQSVQSTTLEAVIPTSTQIPVTTTTSELNTVTISTNPPAHQHTSSSSFDSKRVLIIGVTVVVVMTVIIAILLINRNKKKLKKP